MSEKTSNPAGGASGQGGQKFRQESNQERLNRSKLRMEKRGGKLEAAIGIPEDMLRKAASMAVCKINVDSDLRLAMTAGVRKHLAENPTHFDPRQYLGEGRDNITKVVKHKIEDVLGSANRA